MTPNELGSILGNHLAEATTFFYGLVGNSFTINDELKNELDEGRKRIFGKLIPAIRQLEELGEEDAAECRMIASSTYVNAPIDPLSIAEKLESVLENIDDDSDENFIMNLQSFYMALSFLNPEELKEDAPFLLDHIGYN